MTRTVGMTIAFSVVWGTALASGSTTPECRIVKPEPIVGRLRAEGSLRFEVSVVTDPQEPARVTSYWKTAVSGGKVITYLHDIDDRVLMDREVDPRNAAGSARAYDTVGVARMEQEFVAGRAGNGYVGRVVVAGRPSWVIHGYETIDLRPDGTAKSIEALTADGSSVTLRTADDGSWSECVIPATGSKNAVRTTGDAVHAPPKLGDGLCMSADECGLVWNAVVQPRTEPMNIAPAAQDDDDKPQPMISDPALNPVKQDDRKQQLERDMKGHVARAMGPCPVDHHCITLAKGRLEVPAAYWRGPRFRFGIENGHAEPLAMTTPIMAGPPGAVEVELCEAPGEDCLDPEDLLYNAERGRQPEPEFGPKPMQTLRKWARGVEEGKTGHRGVFDAGWLDQLHTGAQEYGMTDCGSGRCRVRFWVQGGPMSVMKGYPATGYYYDEVLGEQAKITETETSLEGKARAADRISALTRSWFKSDGGEISR